MTVNDRTTSRPVSTLGALAARWASSIAVLVLPPDGLGAFLGARANRLQTGANLALGSALASIGLTIPTVAADSIVLAKRLCLA